MNSLLFLEIADILHLCLSVLSECDGLHDAQRVHHVLLQEQHHLRLLSRPGSGSGPIVVVTIIKISGVGGREGGAGGFAAHHELQVGCQCKGTERGQQGEVYQEDASTRTRLLRVLKETLFLFVVQHYHIQVQYENEGGYGKMSEDDRVDLQ